MNGYHNIPLWSKFLNSFSWMRCLLHSLNQKVLRNNFCCKDDFLFRWETFFCKGFPLFICLVCKRWKKFFKWCKIVPRVEKHFPFFYFILYLPLIHPPVFIYVHPFLFNVPLKGTKLRKTNLQLCFGLNTYFYVFLENIVHPTERSLSSFVDSLLVVSSNYYTFFR